jgi:putative hydrolase of the HAD superfamily
VAEITTLFWDMGGVLLTNGWDRAARHRAVEQFHLDGEEFEDRHELLLDAFETGEATLAEYMHRTVFYRKRNFTEQEFKDFLFAQSEPLPGALEFLGELAATKRYLIAALNNESAEINEYRIQKFDLRKYFAAFLSSCYLGLRKPDAGIYEKALSITQRMPNECLFVDDRALNLECARELGMQTIHCRNLKQMREDMGRFGVPPKK